MRRRILSAHQTFSVDSDLLPERQSPALRDQTVNRAVTYKCLLRFINCTIDNLGPRAPFSLVFFWLFYCSWPLPPFVPTVLKCFHLIFFRPPDVIVYWTEWFEVSPGESVTLHALFPYIYVTQIFKVGSWGHFDRFADGDHDSYEDYGNTRCTYGIYINK